MAKKEKFCCRCNKKMTFLEQENPIVMGNEEYILCMDCFQKLLKIERNESVQQQEQLFEEYKSIVSDVGVINILNERMENIHKESVEMMEFHAEESRKDSRSRLISAADNNVIVSTTDNICGYNIDEYIGMVSRESIFANEIKTGSGEMAMPKGGSVTTSSVIFKDKDERRMLEKISESKNNIMEGLIRDCYNLNCNGLIGVRLDVGIVGTNIVKVSAYGTAVRISPIG